MAEEETKTGGYGKRPMWQWILIYLIIGGLIYYAIYYFAFANKGGALHQLGKTLTKTHPITENNSS